MGRKEQKQLIAALRALATETQGAVVPSWTPAAEAWVEKIFLRSTLGYPPTMEAVIEERGAQLLAASMMFPDDDPPELLLQDPLNFLPQVIPATEQTRRDIQAAESFLLYHAPDMRTMIVDWCFTGELRGYKIDKWTFVGMPYPFREYIDRVLAHKN